MNEHSDQNPIIGMNLLNAHLKMSRDNWGNLKGMPPCLSIPKVENVQVPKNHEEIMNEIRNPITKEVPKQEL